ncbi:MAG: PAS domain S-box protein [Campylobacterota bacterium]|nr:PAS domain S-box protein [Campylobacterota bacterium]
MKYSYSIVNTLLNMPDTNVCILDEEHRITNYSQSFANLIKKNTNIDIEKGMSIFDTALNDELKKKMKEDVNYVLKHKYFNEFETDDNYIFNKSYSIIEDNNTHLGILIIYNVIQDTCNINYKQQYELMVFKNIANNLPVGIALIDHKSDDRPVLFVNKKFEHLTGYKKNEMLGKSCMVIKNNKINKKANQTVNQTIKNKQSCEVEIKHFTKSGKEIYNLINVSPLLDNEKNVLYYMIILQDITESIEYRKQNTIKRLAEGLTHEINTAIFSIKGNLEMLLDDVNAIEDDDKKNIMLDSLQNIRKSKRIIQDIVKTLHYTNDVGENNKSLISINNSIKDSLKNYEDKIERNDIDIFIDIDKELNIIF